MKKLRVTVEGKTYEVIVEIVEDSAPPLPVHRPPVSAALVPVVSAPSAAPAPAPALRPSAGASSPDAVTSPLSGKVVSLDVTIGDTVAEGAQVATVEAMKMNTYIYAPKAGKVTALHVAPGDGVDEGASLLTITC
jgi:glutaconyl-CoA/methylmalonyl-CoA decarboxylase subunit gamma